MAKKVLVIHGPNLNLLGEREPGVYGSTSFSELNQMLMDHEGAIIDKLHSARLVFDAVIINAGAYTHYSYAIRDAIHDIRIPCIEVHISNIHAREEFRNHSVISPVCHGTIAGFGIQSYLLALHAAAAL